MQILKLDKSYFDKVTRLIRTSDKNFSWSGQQILESINKDFVLGLFEDERLKAVTILNSIFETAELLYICVDQSSKNQGLGYKILKESFAYLLNQNVSEVLLEVDVSNHVAIKLYDKLGFKKISTRKNYYKKGDGSYNDALIYSLKIY